MRILILGDHLPLTAEITAYARKRFDTALCKFDRRIQDVIIRVSDINGPKHGDDKRCRVTINLLRLGGGKILIEHIAGDLYAAIDAVANRAKVAVVRRVQKAKSFTHDSANGMPAF